STNVGVPDEVGTGRTPRRMVGRDYSAERRSQTSRAIQNNTPFRPTLSAFIAIGSTRAPRAHDLAGRTKIFASDKSSNDSASHSVPRNPPSFQSGLVSVRVAQHSRIPVAADEPALPMHA